MIRASGIDGQKFSHGIEIGIRDFSGAHAARVIGGSNTVVGEHSHDWPVLSLYVMGNYRKISDRGETSIIGPSVVLHGAGQSHANHLNDAGLEQIDLQFDPHWLGTETAGCDLDGVHFWIGGQIAAAGTQLAALWSSLDRSEEELAQATGRFLHLALNTRQRSQPVWLSKVLQQLDIGRPLTAPQLAQQLGLHPVWLAQAYRAAMGEGIRQTLQRRRVEYATSLLRRSVLTPAEIAAAAGFCDQSHMNRIFRQLLGRTPSQVRSEGKLLDLCPLQ